VLNKSYFSGFSSDASHHPFPSLSAMLPKWSIHLPKHKMTIESVSSQWPLSATSLYRLCKIQHNVVMATPSCSAAARSAVKVPQNGYAVKKYQRQHRALWKWAQHVYSSERYAFVLLCLGLGMQKYWVKFNHFQMDWTKTSQMQIITGNTEKKQKMEQVIQCHLGVEGDPPVA